jgi:hypothetical protein
MSPWMINGLCLDTGLGSSLVQEKSKEKKIHKMAILNRDISTSIYLQKNKNLGIIERRLAPTIQKKHVHVKKMSIFV